MRFDTRCLSRRCAHAGVFIPVLGLLLCAGPAASAAVTEETAPGEYRLSFVAGDGNTYTPVVRVTRVDGKLGADYTAPGFEIEPENVRVRDGELLFDITLDLNGEELSSTYFLKVDGEKVSGVIAWELGGQEGEIDVTGSRVAAVKPAAPSAAGTWRFEFTGGDGTEYKVPVKVEPAGEGWAVTVSIGNEVFKSTEVKVEGDTLAFHIVTRGQNGDVHSEVSGKAADGVMTGTIEHDDGGNTETTPFTAPQIAPAGGLASLTGRWRIAFDIPEGERAQLDLHVEPVGEGLAGRIESPDGSGPVVLSNLRFDGGKLHWAYTTDHEGLPADLTYHATIDGDGLVGRIDYVYDGQTGVMEMTGERVK